MEIKLTNNFIPICFKNEDVFKSKEKLLNSNKKDYVVQLIVRNKINKSENALSILITYRYNKEDDLFSIIKIKIKKCGAVLMDEVDATYETPICQFENLPKSKKSVDSLDAPLPYSISTLFLKILFYNLQTAMNLNIKFEKNKNGKIEVSYSLVALKHTLYLNNISNDVSEYNIIEDKITESIVETAAKIGIVYTAGAIFASIVSGIKGIFKKNKEK